jgi:TPR repeat protein
VALAVILGAMAFNFRQDIGQLVIDLGQKISGEQPAVAPTASPSPDTKPGSQTPAEAGASESQANRPDAANPATAPSAQPSSSVNSSADPRSTGAATTHDTPASGGTRGSTPATSAGGGTANRTATAAPTGSAAVNAASGPEIGSEPGSGQEEFNAAREMLRGDHRHRDLTKAVNLLWAGVRKGYVPAEVTLADLYRRGDGVTKNCDQAQVLLVAASKKGSPEARQKLEQMAEEGCSD